MIHKTGCIISPKDNRDFRLKPARAREYPKSFSLPPPFKIHNQESVNSCVAHAVATCMEQYNLKQQGSFVEMSKGWLYGIRQDGDYMGEGLYLRQCLKTAQKIGTVPENTYDGSQYEMPEAKRQVDKVFTTLKSKSYPNRITSYFRCDNAAAIKSALMGNSYVICAVEWFADFNVNSYGLIETNYTESLNNHCIVIYGWCESGWLICNSWSEEWGINGCAILPGYIPILEAWGLIDDIVNKQIKIKKPLSAVIDNKFKNKIRREVK